MTTLWSKLIPLLGVVVLIAAIALPMNPALAAICLLTLMGTVICAVHHAEVVAHRVGEPFGTLVLALAVTIIAPPLSGQTGTCSSTAGWTAWHGKPKIRRTH